MKRLIAMMMALMMLLGLVACGGGGSTDPNAGVYEASSAEMWGLEIAVEDVYAGGFSVELKDGGKCKITVDGQSASGSWSLTDGAFQAEAGGVELFGTLADGVMYLENVMDSGLNMTFIRPTPANNESNQPQDNADDTQPADDEADTNAGGGSIVGKHPLVFADINGTKMDEAMLESVGFSENSYLIINEDMTGDIVYGGQSYGEFVYREDGVLDFTVMEMTRAYEIEGDTITVDMANGMMFLTFRFEGGAISSTPTQTTKETPKPTEVPEAPKATYPGEPTSSGDGKIADKNEFYRLAKFLWDMENDYKKKYATYEFVVDYIGIEGLDKGGTGPNSMSTRGDHYFIWKHTDTMYMHVGFRYRDDTGVWTLSNMNTSGFAVSDIPADIKVVYPTVSELTGEVSDVAGKQTIAIQYDTSDYLDVSFNMPNAGWCYAENYQCLDVVNVPTADKIYSNSPKIKIMVNVAEDKLIWETKYAEEIKELDARVIGGVEMKGSSFKLNGMPSIEYYGQLPNGLWAAIRCVKLTDDPGTEADGIINSITFG